MDFPNLDRFPHIIIDDETRKIMQDVSICRDDECEVPKKHPFYPTPDVPPFYYGKRPCMPVVPTNLATGKVMVIGEYPNCRFGSVVNENGTRLEKFIPVADINEPFEGGRYFDGISVRDYPTELSLETNYLTPLGLNLRQDVWLTNVIKCYLMRPNNIRDYKDTGWDTPPVEASFDTDDDYLDIASVCVQRHLIKEVEHCQPKLIISLGQKAYRMVHAKDNFANPSSSTSQAQIAGKVLKANEQVHAFDKRDDLFLKFNVVHLYHPSFLARLLGDLQRTGTMPDQLTAHREEHIPAVKDFLDTLNIV